MIELRRRAIGIEEVLDSVQRLDAGAVVLFLGTVRSDPGVAALEYEVYRGMALKKLREVAERAKETFGALEVSVVHRLGRVPVGRPSVAVAASAPHRREAFAACEWAMDEVKRIVPIWKGSARRSGRVQKAGRLERSAGPSGPARSTPRRGKGVRARSGGHRGPLPANEAHVPR